MFTVLFLEFARCSQPLDDEGKPQKSMMLLGSDVWKIMYINRFSACSILNYGKFIGL